MMGVKGDPMRLSEAIRLGAMLRPQGFEDFIRDSGEGFVVSCALGAAAEAIGSPTVGDSDDAVAIIDAAFGSMLDIRRRCPVPGCRVRRITGNVIAHLNDTHRWTRERIAEWVATLESADDRRDRPGAADASDPHADSNTGNLSTRV